MVKFYESFPRFLALIKRGGFDGDTPDSFYYFQCPNDAQTINQIAWYMAFPHECLEPLVGMLRKAELEGRVSWRINYHETYNIIRFRNALQCVRELGANIPTWDVNSEYGEAHWQLPDMRNFLGDHVAFPCEE